jgi:hypothetical protein
MQKNQKITAASKFVCDYADTAEKNKLAPQTTQGLKQYFFLIAVSSPSLKTHKF